MAGVVAFFSNRKEAKPDTAGGIIAAAIERSNLPGRLTEHASPTRPTRRDSDDPELNEHSSPSRPTRAKAVSWDSFSMSHGRPTHANANDGAKSDDLSSTSANGPNTLASPRSSASAASAIVIDRAGPALAQPPPPWQPPPPQQQHEPVSRGGASGIPAKAKSGREARQLANLFRMPNSFRLPGMGSSSKKNSISSSSSAAGSSAGGGSAAHASSMAIAGGGQQMLMGIPEDESFKEQVGRSQSRALLRSGNSGREEDGGGDGGEAYAVTSVGQQASALCEIARVRLRNSIGKCISGASAAVAAQLSQASWIGPELAEIFREAAPPIALHPGEVLIEQGQECNAIYLVISGTLVLTKLARDGDKTREVGRLHAGALVGDISFLIGTLPSVTVAAPAARRASFTSALPGGDGGMGGDGAATVVNALTHQQVVKLMEDNPRLMQRFFFAVAANLSKHLQETAEQLKSMIHTNPAESDNSGGGSSGASGPAGSVDISKLHPYELAVSFGLPVESEDEAAKRLLAVRECRVYIEDASDLSVSSDLWGRIYLFSTHICIEHQSYLFFTKRKAIPLGDVLGLVYTDLGSSPGMKRDGSPSGDAAGRSSSPNNGVSGTGAGDGAGNVAGASPSFGRGASPASFNRRASTGTGAGGGGSGAAVRAFDLEMRGASLRLAMEANACASFARLVERARLNMVDTLDQGFENRTRRGSEEIPWQLVEAAKNRVTMIEPSVSVKSMADFNKMHAGGGGGGGGERGGGSESSGSDGTGRRPPNGRRNSEALISLAGGGTEEEINGIKVYTSPANGRPPPSSNGAGGGASSSGMPFFASAEASGSSGRNDSVPVMRPPGSSGTKDTANPSFAIKSKDDASFNLLEKTPAPAPPPKGGRRGRHESVSLTPNAGAPGSASGPQASTRSGGPISLEELVRRQLDENIAAQTGDTSTAGEKNHLQANANLTLDEWTYLLRGAKYRTYSEGQVVLDKDMGGRTVDGLLQVVTGTMRVVKHVPGRPQDLVVGRLGIGELIGVTSLLFSHAPFAKVVCDSEEGATIRLPRSWLNQVFEERPIVAGKFYFFLAQRQAMRLKKVTNELEEAKELQINDSGVGLPQTVNEFAANEAFFMLFHKFVRTLKPEDKRRKYEALMQFVHEVRGLRREADPHAIASSAKRISDKYIRQGAAASVFESLPPGPHRENTLVTIDRAMGRRGSGGSDGSTGSGKRRRGSGEGGGLTNFFRRTTSAFAAPAPAPAPPALSSSSSASAPAAAAAAGGGKERAPSDPSIRTSIDYYKLRHAFDDALALAFNALEEGCAGEFLQSANYEYVITLKMKEQQPLSTEYFRVLRLLGSGAFGEVVEVVKRDCGKHYAMKVMEKSRVIETFGEDRWDSLVIVERNLLASLHHPLLINLAYAFQNIKYLVLVLDVCHGGDLDDYGFYGEERLDENEIRFVGLETAAVLMYLHSQKVVFRDMKPANLLLDDGGHVRLIDFGVSTQGKNGKDPWCNEFVGSGAYMAPEIKHISETRTKYGYSVDWFSYGVLLYELQEKAYPYGEEPQYEDLAGEFRQPDLVAADGSEIEHMYDLLAGLLDWDANARLGISGGPEGLKAHSYWGLDVDWELVDGRRLRSPLRDRVEERVRGKRATRGSVAENARNTRKPKAIADNARTLVANLNAAELLSQKVDSSQSIEALELSAEQEKLLQEDAKVNVDGWNFVSEHAVAQEYVESAANVVSIV